MSNKYWERRELQEREALINTSIAKIEKQLRYQYIRVEKTIENKIYRLYDKILKEAGTDKALVSDLYKFNRYYDLVEELNEELNKLGHKEKLILGKELRGLYTDNYNLIGKQIGMQTNIEPELVRQAVNKIWCSDGKKWSDRIWTNKKQLVQTLTNGLIDCIATGASSEHLTKVIMEKFSSSYSSANRLARTELSHVYNQSALDKYEEAHIQKVMYLTGRDESTCEECSALDGQIFPIDGAPVIPLHPSCRCCWLAVMEGN